MTNTLFVNSILFVTCGLLLTTKDLYWYEYCGIEKCTSENNIKHFSYFLHTITTKTLLFD